MSKDKTLGLRITEARKARKISAAEIAQLIQTEEFPLDENNIYKWEKGSIPSHPVIYQNLLNWLNQADLGKNKPELSKIIPLGNLQVTLKDHFDLMKEHTEYVKKHASIMERLVEARLLKPEEVNSDESRKNTRRPRGAQGGRRFQE